jgi:hypothetical protein
MTDSVIECSFLIPVRGDSDLSAAELHSTLEWQWLTDEIWIRFGWGTCAPGDYEGFYSDPDTGARISDVSRRYIVAITEPQLNELRSLLAQACIVFHQKCIYLSIGGAVEFVQRPP